MCEAGSASLLPPTGLDTRHRRLANAHVVQMCYVHPVTSPAPEYTMSTTTIRLPDELKARIRSEEHTSELQSLMRNSYAVFCLKKTKHQTTTKTQYQHRRDKK